MADFKKCFMDVGVFLRADYNCTKMDSKKTLLIIGGAALTFVFLLIIFIALVAKGSGQATITYWGLWEPEAIYQTAIADFKKTHPNVTIKYQKQSPLNYRDRMNTALANGSVDIVRIHNTWAPTMRGSLATVPASVYTVQNFKTTFYPVAFSDLVYANRIYAIPMEFEGLSLYTNDEIFRSGGQTVPTIWDGDQGFMSVARKLTVKDSNGRIQTSGAAMGTASNVDHWQDILALMMLQTGTDLNKSPDTIPASEALSYYAAFTQGDRTWDETLDNSTLAFANGKVAMYFGPSWRFFDIKQIAPNLAFSISPVPQLVGGTTVNYASYWAEAVSKKSRNQALAFEFLKFLSSKDEMARLYAAEAKLRGFGEPYSRVDMANLLTSDPAVGPYIKAAPTAKSWYLASFTRDGETGINSRIGKYFADAVNIAKSGGDPKGALGTASSGVDQVLGSYGLK
jgi:ABC-type glycerol-3-phosphate transport system substrate-binding protein